MKKLSVSLSGHHTSISIEPEFLDALNEIARRQNKSVSAIVRDLDNERAQGTNLSSAIRVWVLKNK